ncbi:MAG: hypothetical protein JRJ21_00225 [Deltaproteobacteria bacterium]|nr:hypothetical protein [Deltaproteobacteria bacterium]
MKNVNTGKKICSVLEKKLALFKRYLSVTKRMKETLKDKEESNLEGLVSERQDCINKIDGIGLSMEKIVKANSEKYHIASDKFRGLIEGYLKDIKNIIETIAPIDRELMVMVREEGGSIKNELLKMRNVRQAAQGYKNERTYSPRFLDMKR